MIDEYTRECLAIDISRHSSSMDIIERLFELFIFHGTPEYIRSDNGPEFISKAIRRWMKVGRCTNTLYRTWKPLGERLY